MRNKIGLAGVLALMALLGSCNNRGKEDRPDGGPCEYKQQVYPATLIALKDMNEEEYEAVFSVDFGNAKDTLPYSSLNNYHYLRRQELPKDSLHIGSRYQYIMQTMISGSCNPHVNSLHLQLYSSGETE